LMIFWAGYEAKCRIAGPANWRDVNSEFPSHGVKALQ
jgi:hypothetical protein